MQCRAGSNQRSQIFPAAQRHFVTHSQPSRDDDAGRITGGAGAALVFDRQSAAPMTLRGQSSALYARVTVLLLCASLMTLLWAGIFTQFAIDRAQSIAASTAENDNLVRLLADDVLHTIRAADLSLGEIAAAYRREGTAFDLAGYATDRKLYLDPNTILTIIDENGDQVASSSTDPTPGNFSLRDNFQYHAANPTDELFISAPRTGRRTNVWTFYLSHRVNKEDGTFGGFAVYGIDAGFLSKLYDRMDLGPHASIALIGRDGIVRARQSDSALEAGMDVSATGLFRYAIANPSSGQLVARSGVDNVVRILSYQWVGDYPLVVALGTSLDTALTAYYARRTVYFFAGGTITLIVLFLGLLAIAMIAKTERTNKALHRTSTHLARAQKLGKIGSFERLLANEHVIWSAETYRIYGLDPETLPPTLPQLLDRVHPDDRDLIMPSRSRAVGGSVEDALDYRIFRTDGDTRWVRRNIEPLTDESGKIIGIVGTVQDITEQKRSEIRVRLLQNVSLAIAEANDFDNSLDVVLRAVCTTTDWAFGEAWVPEPDGKRLALKAVWHADIPALRDFVEKHRDRRLTPETGHVGAAWRARQPAWIPDLAAVPVDPLAWIARASRAGIISSYAVPILYDEQCLAVLRFATVERRKWDQELTESIAAVAAQLGTALVQKQAQQALKDSERQLRQAQKMQAIGTLTGGLAHDFNNLLGAIVGNLELLRDLVGHDPQASELSRDALQAALRGGELTRSLLAFARRQPLRPQNIDANELIGNLSKLLRRVLGEQIEFHLSLSAHLPPVKVDPAQLEAAITNLATNARDAMPNGGRLTIATRTTLLDRHNVPTGLEARPGEYVVIEVSDTGTGIPPDVMDHIFEPFFTTKTEGHGSGLGLSMVFGFISQSGGHVSAYSEPGLGTTLRLYLPRGDESRRTALDEVVGTITPGGGETILVVEDNDLMRNVVAKQIQSLGYRVIEASSADAALTFLADIPQIDLLFTDVVMPGTMDGLGLANQAASLRPDVRILLTSGFPDTRFTDGIQDYRLLSKPYRKEELAQALRETLDGPSPEA
jgi:PAS domain S-box-containing protein